MTDTQRAVWAHRDIDASGFRDIENTPLGWVVWSKFELSPGIHELIWEETLGLFFFSVENSIRKKQSKSFL